MIGFCLLWLLSGSRHHKEKTTDDGKRAEIHHIQVTATMSVRSLNLKAP